MEFKKGDKVRYNKEGIKEFEYNIKYGEICFGVVTAVEDNPYIPNEKMITFIDYKRQKHQLREIYLEKDDIDFSYLLNLAKTKGNVASFVMLAKMSLDYLESLFSLFNSPSSYLSFDMETTEIVDLCEFIIKDNEGLFSSIEKQSATNIIEKAKVYNSIKNRQKELINYLNEDNLIDLIKNIYKSMEFNMIDEFTSDIDIKKIDEGFTFSFSGYTIIGKEKKKVNVKDKFIRKN